MIKIENYQVVGWEHAFRGMRNPKNSWAKSDSSFHETARTEYLDDENNIKEMLVWVDALKIGEKDHELAMKLVKGGPVHAKFCRMIAVYVDVTAPLYWWKEYDTYKVGTVANSCSTMHKIHEKEFTLDDFSTEHLFDESAVEGVYYSQIAEELLSSKDVLRIVVEALNHFRKLYLETKDKKYWWQMIQLLPSSYNQKRTLMLNYEVLANMYKSRKNHKLDEWRELCKWIEGLPYSEIITGDVEEKQDD